MQWISTILLLSGLPGILLGYAEGPDAGSAGVPREAACGACHRGSSGSGSVKVDFPSGLSYTPGVQQRLLVTISDPEQSRWGFQLTARRSDNSAAQAGSFTPGADGHTQVVCTQTTFTSENYGACPASMPLQYTSTRNAGHVAVLAAR